MATEHRGELLDTNVLLGDGGDDGGDEGDGDDALAMPDLDATRRRIKETLQVLDSFGSLRAPGRSRKEYVAQVG